MKPATQNPSYSYFGSSFPLNRTTSPLVYGPFKMLVNQIKSAFFSSATFQKKNQAEVISENNVSTAFTEEMVAYWDANSNGFLDNGESALFTYVVKIFVSKDASYLAEAFEKTAPGANEIAFFLEDNRTDIFSGSTAMVKIGSDFQKNLAKKEIIATIETSNSFFTRYHTDGENYLLDFTDSQIIELIKTGQIANTSLSMAIGLFQVINVHNIILAPAYSIIAKGLFWITASARTYIEFQEQHWNPNYKSENETENPKTEFVPVLFSSIKSRIDKVYESEYDGVTFVGNALKNALEQKKSGFRSHFSSFAQPNTPDFAISYTLNSYILGCLQSIENGLDYIISTVSEVMEIFKYIGDKWLNAINAFYCGLWNSIVEIFLGFIDMIGFVFNLFSVVANATKDAQSLVPQCLEIIDETLQTILKTDVVKIVTDVISKIIEKLKTFNIYALTNSISIEQVSYFLGSLLGQIVQQIVDEFISGGIKGVYDFLDKLGTVGPKVKDFILAKIKSITNISGVASIENVIALLKYFVDLLKKGADDILKFIDDLFDILEDAAELTAEIIDKIKHLLGLSPDEIRLFDNLELKFVKIVENTEETVCSMCKVINH
jgi:hypothetical protein